MTSLEKQALKPSFEINTTTTKKCADIKKSAGTNADLCVSSNNNNNNKKIHIRDPTDVTRVGHVFSPAALKRTQF